MNRKMNEINNIIKSTEMALNNTAVQKDKILCSFLLEVKKQAMKGYIFYDYKREFSQHISRFCIQNDFVVPDPLLKLMVNMQMSNMWTGL